MEKYEKTFEVKWADLDPNRHMRHTAYNDYCAHLRVGILKEAGLSLSRMEELGIGPILFREETKYLREVGMEGDITINCTLLSMRQDGSRWSFSHEIFRSDGIQAAIVAVDGAWLDLQKRKLTLPPKEILDAFLTMPKSADFKLIPTKVKG